MLNLRSAIRTSLLDALQKVAADLSLSAITSEDVVVQYPPASQDTQGDYASPIALVLGKRTQRNPMEIAEAIKAAFLLPEFVERVEVAAPGFLNFTIRDEWFSRTLDDIVETGSEFGRSRLGQGETVNLEFVSANPTGLPTFGNGRTLFWADTLANVLTASGYAVTREYYINDVGNQMRLFGESILRRILQARGIDVPFPPELYQGEEVHVIAVRVDERLREDVGHEVSEQDLTDERLIAQAARIGVEENMRATQEIIEKVCHVHFDLWSFEHLLHERGDVARALALLKESGKTYEQDGALWFRATEFGDDKDRVLVRSNGEVTYFVADIAYHLDKFRRGFNVIADFWGADHYGYIARLRGALQALGQDVSRFRVVITQLVHVVEHGEKKKMSKRQGTAIALHDVIEQVGVSAARFFLMMKALSSQMEFDLDLAREQSQKNPVYYVQYAFVRLASVMRKAKEQNVLDGELLPPLGASVTLTQPTEHALMRLLFRFPEVAEDVAVSWDVQRLPQFALELARTVHQFYDTVSILTAESKELISARLTLALAARTVLGNTLDLLGVEKREIM